MDSVSIFFGIATFGIAHFGGHAETRYQAGCFDTLSVKDVTRRILAISILINIC